MRLFGNLIRFSSSKVCLGFFWVFFDLSNDCGSVDLSEIIAKVS